SYADLSFVVPLTAVGYITNTIGARFFLKELSSKERWFGTLMVALGVSLISLDKHVEGVLRTKAIVWLHQFYLLLTPKESIVQSQSPAAFWTLFTIRAMLLICVVASIIYFMIAFVAGLLWFADRRRQRALGLDFTPPATIFKPVRGADAQAYENFASFCRQQYPEYQIIFGVQDAADPVVPVIKKLIADFPDRDIEIVVSTNKIGYNAKVSNLENMFARAK